MTLTDLLILLSIVTLGIITAAIVISSRRRQQPAKSNAVADRVRRQAGLIRVEMLDADHKLQFEPVDFPPDHLPESFEADTTFHVGDRHFQVVQASPMTAAEFRASGRLRLVLREQQIGMMDPHKILFTLPTINDFLPPIAEGSTKLDKQVVEIHEDDWRQVEFVSTALQDQIDEDLAGVRHIYEHERVGIGFRNLHIRKAVPEPMVGVTVTVDELIAAFDAPPMRLEGVAYQGVAGVMERSFAVRLLCGLELFGVTDDTGRIAALCLTHARPNNAFDRDLPSLARLARSNGLCLVHWCRAEQFPPDESALREGLPK